MMKKEVPPFFQPVKSSEGEEKNSDPWELTKFYMII